MLDHSWTFHETSDGLTFEHACFWKPVTLLMVSDKLKNYHVIGAYEVAGELFLLMTKDGSYKLIDIITHDGYHEINSMELTSVEASQILKRYCTE